MFKNVVFITIHLENVSIQEILAMSSSEMFKLIELFLIINWKYNTI